MTPMDGIHFTPEIFLTCNAEAIDKPRGSLEGGQCLPATKTVQSEGLDSAIDCTADGLLCIHGEWK